jgi:hypothetical protein
MAKIWHQPNKIWRKRSENNEMKAYENNRNIIENILKIINSNGEKRNQRRNGEINRNIENVNEYQWRKK